MRKLNDVRKYIDKTIMTTDREKPEARVARQIVDLELLKYVVSMNEYHDPAVLQAIESCIQGFIWIYSNGGTHDNPPSIVYKDHKSMMFYNNFLTNWSNLQDFMRTNMSLMEV